MKKWLLIAIVTLISASSFLHAQSSLGDRWIGVGNGFSGGALLSLVNDGVLYVVYNGNTNAASSTLYHLVRLDGAGWTQIDSFSCGAGSLRCMFAYRGQIYIGGEFDALNGIPGTVGIARRTSDHWEAVGTGVGNSNRQAFVRSMAEYKGELYAAGSFSTMDGVPANNIARWDGSHWRATDLNADFSSNTVAIDYLTVFRDDLYATWRYMPYWDTFDSVAIPGVTRWNGHAWTPLEVDSTITSMFVYDDHLYVTGPHIKKAGNVAVNGIARWDGSSWSDGNDRNDWKEIGHLTMHNGKYYSTSGDGRSVMRWNGSRWDTTFTFDQYLNFLIECNGALFAGGWFYTTQNHIARLCEAGNCGEISGSVFYDRNGNCARDAADTATRNRFVEVTPGPFSAPLDPNGSYSLYVPYGTYSIKPHPYLHWSSACPGGPYTATLDSSASTSLHNDFAVRPDLNVEDLRMSLAGGHARPGEPGHYVITYSNVGTITASGTVRLTLDPLVTFVSSTPAPDRINGNVIEWDFVNLLMDESRTITVITRTSADAPVGGTICGVAEIVEDFGGVSHSNDAVIADNSDSWCVRVSNSYDPNDLDVSPKGFEGNGELAAEDSVLTYQVHFQNTGNDTAFKVVVIDTLSSALDITSIQTGAASHPCIFAVGRGNVLTWTFDDIMLPDSGASVPNSQGFFKYSVHIKPNLSTGTQISNRVGIYFDYNAPVYTNSVISVITNVSSVADEREASSGIAIYPNPAAGALTVRGAVAGIVRLSDMLGRSVLSLSASGDVTIDVSSLPPGMYLLSLPMPTGTVTRRVAVVR
jgi:uncharacterized repeat protein (TIGR01451 family)